MNKRKANKKQMSLSQSLFRSKAVKNETSNLKTLSNTIKDDGSSITNCSKNRTVCHSRSDPEGDDCDDSFDLFLPRKNRPKASSSQGSFFETRKRSKYFNESGELRVPKVITDDDLELALAVSLQESKGTAALLKPPEPDGTALLLKTPRTESNQHRGKQKLTCSNSLVMRRTPEERERIITEKVAVVLMNKEEDAHSTVASSRPKESFSLYSPHLKRQIYEMKTLWTLAQTDLSQVKLENFFIDGIMHYLPSNCINDDGIVDTNPADPLNASGVKPVDDAIQRAYSSEDMFGESDDADPDLIPSPKRPRCSPSLEALDNLEATTRPSGSDNIIEEQLSLKVDSLDIISLEVEESHSSANISTGKSIDEVSNQTSGSAHEINENPPNSSKSPPKCVEMTESSRKPLNILKHYLQMSADMLRVSNSRVSRVSKVTNGAKTFFAHHCIFQVRCPELLRELETNPDCFTEYSPGVCEALFGYIYAADIASCLELDSAQRKELLGCAKKFRINCLVAELEISGIEGFVREEKNARNASIISYADQPNISFSACVPDDTETFGRPHSTPIEIKCITPVEPQAESNEVFILDSDSCSVEEIVNSEDPASECANSEDEVLDKYLRDDMRLVESKATQGEGKPLDEAIQSLPRTESVPKKSIDLYFEDSFPSLADIGVVATPANGSSKPQAIVNCVTPGGQLVVSELASPLPDYERMVSPDLQVALHKYGIRRGIGRQKAVALLRYIYDQIHPPADHPAVAKALCDVKNPSQLNDTSGSENDVFSLSSESSEDMDMFEDLGDVASSQLSSTECAPSLILQVGDFIKSNTSLYAVILSYVPIWLNKFHKTVKENGIKCNKRELMAVLDELGITFRTERTEKRMRRKGSKKIQLKSSAPQAGKLG